MTSQMLTYFLFNTQSMLLSGISRKRQPYADLHAVQNPEHAPVSNKEEGLARSWLTSCSKPKACSCQEEAGRGSQMLTYILFKTQSMILSAKSRKGQPDPDLQPVQNPEHDLVSNKQEGPSGSWLTNCSKPRVCSCQQQQEGPARSWLTYCWKPRAWSCKQQGGRASQMLTYILFETQSMLLSAPHRKGQRHPDLHPVQNPEHHLVSNKQEGPARSRLTNCSKPGVCSCQQQAGRPARSWLTRCSKPRASSCQQQGGRAGQMLTYILFKTQSMILSATSRKGQPDADLHPIQKPEHDLVSNKQEGPARCWLTNCSIHRVCFCQQQAGRASHMLTYLLFKTQSMILSAARRKG